MEKQHNRGQDGAGIATIKLDVKPGNRYISRYRATGSKAVSEIFEYLQNKFAEVQKTNPHLLQDAKWLKDHISFTGEVLMGHLRYVTWKETVSKAVILSCVKIIGSPVTLSSPGTSI